MSTNDGYIAYPFPDGLTVRNGETLHITGTAGDEASFAVHVVQGSTPPPALSEYTMIARPFKTWIEVEVQARCPTCGEDYTARWRTTHRRAVTYSPCCGAQIELS